MFNFTLPLGLRKQSGIYNWFENKFHSDKNIKLGIFIFGLFLGRRINVTSC